MASTRSSAAYRIAVPYAAVLAWTTIALGAVVYFAADAEMREQRDHRIIEELDRLSNQPNRAELLRELSAGETERRLEGVSYVLFDPKGKRVAGTLAISGPIKDAGEPTLQSGVGKDRSARAGAVFLADRSQLVIAADANAIERIKAMVLKVFLAAFLAGLAISLVGGVMLGWYLRKRLKPISATANSIVTGDIEYRVPVSAGEDEFDAAARAINLMLDRIAELMENLRQVSSDIAHDLRKPLMRLLLQADRLGEGKGAERRVVELGDELLMLFSAILRISEVERGGLERSFDRVDLSELMEEVAESFAPALTDDGHAIDWTIAPDIAVLGNRELLAQVAANLLDNARVHTPSGTAIKLELSSRNGRAMLSVEDDGPGVSQDDREKLLQRFFRAETSRSTPGNGLGLSLVAAAARAHGGSVAVADAAPGLRVTVTLPRLGADATG